MTHTPKERIVKRTALVGLALAASTVLIGAPIALAEQPTESQACLDARAELALTLGAVLDLSPEVLDGHDELTDLTPSALAGLLDDDEAGGGAQATIRAALAAGVAVEVTCALPTTTPAPTSTTTPTPDPTLPPPDSDDDESDAPAPVVVDDSAVAVTH